MTSRTHLRLGQSVLDVSTLQTQVAHIPLPPRRDNTGCADHTSAGRVWSVVACPLSSDNMAARMSSWSGTAQQILKNEHIFRHISGSKWPGSLQVVSSRRKATVAGLAEPLSEEARRDMQVMRGVDPSFDKLDLTFENAQEAYKSKTNGEIIRALTVFTLCGVKPLVTYNKEVCFGWFLCFCCWLCNLTVFEVCRLGPFV